MTASAFAKYFLALTIDLSSVFALENCMVDSQKPMYMLRVASTCFFFYNFYEILCQVLINTICMLYEEIEYIYNPLSNLFCIFSLLN